MAQREISCGSYKLTRKDNSGHKCVEVETKRKLTSGEIQMARTMFKDSVDYDLVFICKGGIFHDVTGNARTLGNEITLPTKSYDRYKDFSVSKNNSNYYRYRDDYYKILKAFFDNPFNRDLLPK